MAPCVFFLFLLLNYIVNRINAARIEERYAQFIAKDASPDQGSQEQSEKMMRMETPKRTMSSPACLRSKSPIKKPNSVVSSPIVRKPPSNSIFLREVYTVQLGNSSKSIEKDVILNQETLDIDVNDGNEIVSETSKKTKYCESAPAFKRMMNDQAENKLRDCVSDTTVTIYNKEIIKKDTEL